MIGLLGVGYYAYKHSSPQQSEVERNNALIKKSFDEALEREKGRGIKF